MGTRNAAILGGISLHLLRLGIQAVHADKHTLPPSLTCASEGIRVARMTKIQKEDSREDRPERLPEEEFTAVREKEPVTG